MFYPELCHEMCLCVCVYAQLCSTLCDPMDYTLPNSSVHKIFQARVLCNFLFQGREAP